MQNKDDVIEIDLQELFGLLFHWLWLLILCGIVAGLTGLIVCKLFVTPQYESTTRIFILNKNNSATVSYSDLQTSTQLTKNYTPLIKSRDVLESVIATCGLDETFEKFSLRVKVAPVGDTSLIAITVTDPDPAMAQLLAKEIRIVASDHIKQVMEIQAANLETEANLPTKPAGPSAKKWALVGTMLGVFACAGVLIIQFLLDDTIKSAEDVERYLGLSTLAMIPVIDQNEKNKKKKGHAGHEHYGTETSRESDEEVSDMEVVVQDLRVEKGGEE
ncbi:MAG: protein-tyrosine kinase [Lachnospiraceae bacterium]|nr:protein-tyrosine kinase [Lachnospiraceae bacterium]